MARLLNYSTSSTRTQVDIGRMVLLAAQYAVLGGMAVFILLAIVNTVLGTPQAEPAYSPYDLSGGA